jgi:hypothetical protein
MNTKRTRLVAGLLSAIVVSAPLATALTSSLIFTNLRGTLRVVQGVPCGGVVDVTTSIADGRMEITPSAPRRADAGAVQFDLSRLSLFMTPFTVQHECLGMTATADFREIGVQLVKPVRFTGQPIGSPEDLHYTFTIPRTQVLLFESVLNNLPVPQPETQYEQPSEDVTGEIDLRRGTAQLHVVLSSNLRFRVGCVGKRCVIDEQHRGRQTVDVTGVLVNPRTDTDRDSVPDLIDNCPLVSNRTQAMVPNPVITAPANVTLSSCQVPDIGTATASDVCYARPVAISNNAPSTFAVGRNVVTWSARNGIDPAVTAEQIVTVSAEDQTPPVISCTPAKPHTFEVAAADECAGPTTIRLGSFTLTSGEVIKVEETGKPGVRLINTVGKDKIKHFQAGKGEALVVATDAAGNAARAACGPPPGSREKR